MTRPSQRLFKVPRTARPTSSKVKEALFNIWQPWLIDAMWLDLCAGSGAMGAEALAKGAKGLVAIEVNPAACKMISENLAKLFPPDRFQIIKSDAVKGIKKLNYSFDLIYFDPPYDSNLYLPVLTTIEKICHPETRIGVEHSSYNPLPKTIGSLVQTDCRLYGQTVLSFFAMQG